MKSALCSQGYPRRVLARLPEDGSQGSRELLLALAWLLARGPLLEHLLAQTRVWLGDEIPLWQVRMPGGGIGLGAGSPWCAGLGGSAFPLPAPACFTWPPGQGSACAHTV